MKPDKKETALTGNREPNYMAIVFECRDLLDCGHVDNVPESLQEMRARYNDALARIAQLESKSAEMIYGVSNDGGKTAVAWRDDPDDALAYLALQNVSDSDFYVVAKRRAAPEIK